MYALNIDKKTNRVLSATFPQYARAGAVIVEALPDGDITHYLYQHGAYIYAPLPHPVAPDEPETEPDMWDELDAAYQAGYSEGYAEGVNKAYDE